LHEYKKEKKLIFPAVRVSFVVSKFNSHEVELFVKKFSSMVDYIEFQGFYAYYDITSHLIPAGAHLIKKFNCVEPWRKLIVRANGDVLPCCSFYGYELILGNVKQDTLKSIFNSDACQQLKVDFKNGIYRNKACISCSRSNYEYPITE
jgi:radical SAM protein with 4Fe4S-binding SPASM domain